MKFSPLRFNQYRRDLSIAIYDLSQESRNYMGIADLREKFKHITGAETLAMRYAPNGDQIYILGDVNVQVGPMASMEEIEDALLNKKKLS